MSLARARWRIGVDIGGTFTDVVLVDEVRGGIGVVKVPTTPRDFARGVLDALAAATRSRGVEPADVTWLAHATTVVTNALLEGKGARTALVATRGMKDVLELRRSARASLYDLFQDAPAVLVPRHLRLEVTERIDAQGEVVEALRLEELDGVVDFIKRHDVQAVAVCLLYSFLNDAHERLIGARLRAALPDLPIFLSSEVLPEIREFERTSTTCVCAYVGPILASYLAHLEAAVIAMGLPAPHVMGSSGGVFTVAEGLRMPAMAVESGPAAGVIAAALVGRRLGLDNVLSFDMGGTTAKASLIEPHRGRRMNETDLCYTPATELIALIRARKLSPVELTRAVLARTERVNPTVNAFCTLTADLARAAARRAEEAVMAGGALGPIHGLPFSIKDLAWTAGIRTMGGSPIFEHRVPDTDAPFVRRLTEAGGVMLGKTTTPELGWKALGDSPVTGITRNPWNLGMTSGGSSAGAGVAAAAGLGPLHQGSDGAGSIRIPSAFCGIYGFKPSYGRVPMWPTSNTDSASHTGPMTRTVADAALMLSVMAGPDLVDRTALDAAPADYVARLDDGVRGFSIAWSPDLGGLRVDPDVALVAKQAALAFQGLGAVVEEVNPGFADSREIIRCMWNVHEAGNYGAFLAEYRDRMDPGLVASIEDGLRYSGAEYVAMRGRKLAYWDSVRPLFEKYDLLLTPSVSVAAFDVGRLNPNGWPDHPWDWFDWASFSYPFNFTGQPAASVPAGFTPSGMPVGLQIVGRPWADLTVLQASRAFEQARPWAGKRPPLG